MKRVIAVLLAALSILGCWTFAVCAEDTQEPAKSASGYYIGQILKPGDQITSAYDKCEALKVVYGVAAADAENVTSVQQDRYASEDFIGVVSFQDNIASFTSGELYAGVYTVKGVGDEVIEMETANRTFKNGDEIVAGLDEDTVKLYKLSNGLTLTIDYEYAHTTYNQYTELTAWKITALEDVETSLTIRLQAVFETREPNGFEQFQEKAYTRWLAFLDKVGDVLLRVVPKIIAFWAKVLGKNR